MHASVLRYFLEVAHSGSIRKAAQRLFVASSAVNRQILMLEAELGCELFDRLPNGTRLNAAGRLVQQHVQNTLNDFELLRTELDALKGERTGHIALVAMDSLFNRVLPETLAEFGRDYPAVTHTCLALSPTDVPVALAEGQADIGIAFIQQPPAGTAVCYAAPFPIGVVMTPDHPLARQHELGYDDLRGQPFMLSHQRWPIYATLAPAYAEFVDALQPVLVSNVSPLIKQAVLAGRGLGFFTRLGFLDEIQEGRVAWRPLADPAMRRLKVAVLVRKQQKLSLVQKAFVDELVRQLRQIETR